MSYYLSVIFCIYVYLRFTGQYDLRNAHPVSHRSHEYPPSMGEAASLSRAWAELLPKGSDRYTGADQHLFGIGCGVRIDITREEFFTLLSKKLIPFEAFDKRKGVSRILTHSCITFSFILPLWNG